MLVVEVRTALLKTRFNTLPAGRRAHEDVSQSPALNDVATLAAHPVGCDLSLLQLLPHPASLFPSTSRLPEATSGGGGERAHARVATLHTPRCGAFDAGAGTWPVLGGSLHFAAVLLVRRAAIPPVAHAVRCASLEMAAEPAKRVLVYGGRGALGAAIVAHLKAQRFWVGSVDLAPNEEADINVILKDVHSLQGQGLELQQALDEQLGGGGAQLDAVLCVAGGWAGGNAAHKDFVKNSELMWQQSVWSSVLASQVASKHLREGGLLALTGANAALQATPGMIGYGMAKAAVHHLVKSLGSANGGLPTNASVVGILPVTLDTPMNRKWMPDADHSTWTPLDFVAGLFLGWINGVDRPATGSLVQLITAEGKTNLTLA